MKRDLNWIKSAETWIKQRENSIESGKAQIESNTKQIALLEINSSLQEQQIEFDLASIEGQRKSIQEHIDETENPDEEEQVKE